jgi:hypothetical protein
MGESMTLAASRHDIQSTARCLNENRKAAKEVMAVDGVAEADTRQAARLVKLSEAVFENVVREYLRKVMR